MGYELAQLDLAVENDLSSFISDVDRCRVRAEQALFVDAQITDVDGHLVARLCLGEQQDAGAGPRGAQRVLNRIVTGRRDDGVICAAAVCHVAAGGDDVFRRRIHSLFGAELARERAPSPARKPTWSTF